MGEDAVQVSARLCETGAALTRALAELATAAWLKMLDVLVVLAAPFQEELHWEPVYRTHATFSFCIYLWH